MPGTIGAGTAGRMRQAATATTTRWPVTWPSCWRPWTANAPIEMTGCRTAALVPTAQYQEYGNAAHGLYLTHAGRLNADLLAFIKS